MPFGNEPQYQHPYQEQPDIQTDVPEVTKQKTKVICSIFKQTPKVLHRKQIP